MEKQRSFSFKSRSKFLVFFFIVSSSVLFFSFLSVWVFQVAPLNHQLKFQSFSSLSHTLVIKPRNSTDNVIRNGSLSKPQYNKSDHSSSIQVQVLVKGVDDEKKKIKEKIKVKESEIVLGNKNAANFTSPDIISKVTKKVDILMVNENNTNIEVEKRVNSKCDILNGTWVFDESYPLYKSDSCPFIDEGFSCEANGRLNTNYMKWRWQPHDCNIPRFDAVKMLELIRGKRLVFVGDSINRNQWESMLCLLKSAITDPKRVFETHGRRITKEKGNYSFKFLDYKCTVEYYVSHFLVHEGKGRVGSKRVQTLKIDTLDRGSSRWKGADILVFNSAHWWSHAKTKSGVNYYQERNQVYPHLDVPTAFKRALTTWASWVDKYVIPGKTQVFFRSSAPTHFRGGAWNAGGHCKEVNQPLNYSSNIFDPEKSLITEEVIKQMKTPVTILNVTSLSEFRIDGHPSIYGKKPGKASRSHVEDCSHWCLPGVPDTWNELLYYYLQSNKKVSSAV
ncbi:hypothetical protein C5167_030738 [Papaver somniferum]|uniref:protein trichome birefringence-like 6 n=1 Tax=Papaver somniferum TaxID=3469 RepID=UPI000E6F5E18|nr:protein trichome birefringence-like 6 [Papaver somniferum]RZC89045.1 hypothetical protein C5167_030738 [Papaver somniferum]